ncbi:retrotransposable element Tf2 [Tanacetum coccineum]
MKWLPKLMGYDYEVVYKKGSENDAADALSRLGSGSELLSMFVSSVTTDLMKRVQDTWESNEAVSALIGSLKNGQAAKKHYAWINENKYAHFIGLSHPFNAAKIAQVFLDSVYKLHGMPESIVSDRDKVFISAFWKELFKVLKVKLHMSTTYHPQTDRQTEVVNRCLEGYLRWMTGEQPKKWFEWLSLVELCRQDTFGQRTLLAREEAIQVLKFHLQRSQNRMKQQADKSRSEREFEVGDMVFLKLQPHRQVTIRVGKQNKFS